MHNTQMSFLGFTLDVIGKILVAYTAVMVHHRVWQEHKIDNKVFKSMKSEKILAFIGILFIIAGYFLQLPTKLPNI